MTPKKAPRNHPSRAQIAEQRAPDLARFDTLPASAHVDSLTVCALRGISYPTLWRLVGAGIIPQPVRAGRLARWRVGDLRKAA